MARSDQGLTPDALAKRTYFRLRSQVRRLETTIASGQIKSDDPFYLKAVEDLNAAHRPDCPDFRKPPLPRPQSGGDR